MHRLGDCLCGNIISEMSSDVQNRLLNGRMLPCSRILFSFGSQHTAHHKRANVNDSIHQDRILCVAVSLVFVV